MPPPAPDIAPAAPDTPRASLEIALRPVRAGLNIVTAIVDGEVTVANTGPVPAASVRVALTLVAAHAGQQEAVDAIHAAPPGRPIVPAFALAPGETRTIRSLVSAALADLPGLRVSGREMLVPLVLVDVEHTDPDGTARRLTQGFVVGVERVDSPRLAPFWFDAPRMVDQVAARPAGPPATGPAA